MWSQIAGGPIIEVHVYLHGKVSLVKGCKIVLQQKEDC